MEQNQIIIYQTPNGETAIDVKIEKETVWLTQAQIVELFERDQSVISRHIKNIFKEKELDEKAICKICILLVQINPGDIAITHSTGIVQLVN
ncbi:hypothetical protein ACVWYN_001550 [Pedobacter sp. UYP24]